MTLASQDMRLSLPLSPVNADTRLEPSLATASDYIALLKPRVMSLVVFTAFVGLMIAPAKLHPVMAFTALLCIAIGAGAAGALNMWYEADLDAVMSRTAQRPIPRGRIAPAEALAFGVLLAVFAVVSMGLFINVTAALLLAVTILFYAVVYTMWLKRRTAQNIVIGGAAGAFPPMIGWAAATGSVSVEPILLFLIIFFWTPPHFWALSLVRTEDYARAGIPMLPVTAGTSETTRQILIYSLALLPVGLAPFLFGYAGALYAGIAAASGAFMVALALRLRVARPGAASDRAAKQLFGFSLLYLFVVFAALLIDQGLALPFGRLRW